MRRKKQEPHLLGARRLAARNDLRPLVLPMLTVELKKLAQVELRSLKDLDLADVNVLQGVDTLASLLDLLANNLRHELLHQLLQVASGGLAVHDLEHLLADGTDLSVGGVGGLTELVLAALGEGDGEEAEEVTVSGLDVNEGLDQGLICFKR